MNKITDLTLILQITWLVCQSCHTELSLKITSSIDYAQAEGKNLITITRIHTTNEFHTLLISPLKTTLNKRWKLFEWKFSQAGLNKVHWKHGSNFMTFTTVQNAFGTTGGYFHEGKLQQFRLFPGEITSHRVEKINL